MYDHYAPRTMMLVGAVLSGGDALALAKKMVENDLTSSEDKLLLSSEENSNLGQNDEKQRSNGIG
jgi:hypothetical protein